MNKDGIQKAAERAKSNALERALQLGIGAAFGDRQAGYALQVEWGALGISLCVTKVEADETGTVRAFVAVPPKMATDDVDEYLAALTAHGGWHIRFERDELWPPLGL